MPRIVSIARSRPTLSSSVKWSVTVAGMSGSAISVAIAPFPWFSAHPGSAVSTPAHPAPAGGIAAPGSRLEGEEYRCAYARWRASLRPAVGQPPPVADARGVAVARVLRPHAARRARDLAAPALRRRPARAGRGDPPRG